MGSDPSSQEEVDELDVVAKSIRKVEKGREEDEGEESIVEFYRKVAIVKNVSSLSGNWGRNTSIFCKKPFDPGLRTDWGLEITANCENPFNYWFILDEYFGNEYTKTAKVRKTVEYLYQLDGGGFYRYEGGFNRHKADEKYPQFGVNPKTILDAEKKMRLKFYCDDWKWGIQAFDPDGKCVCHSYCIMEKKKDGEDEGEVEEAGRDRKYYFGVGTLTLNKASKVKILSFSTKRNV